MTADPFEIPTPEDPFTEPWQARIFALMVEMNARGHFAWRECQECLAARISADARAGIERPYYDSWLGAAEDLLRHKGHLPEFFSFSSNR